MCNVENSRDRKPKRAQTYHCFDHRAGLGPALRVPAAEDFVGAKRALDLRLVLV